MHRVTAPAPNRRPVRELGGVIIVKAGAMATIALAVVHSGLSAFDQALIIALSSAALTGLFTVAAAWVAVKFAGRPLHEEVKATHEAVTAVAEQTEALDPQAGGRRSYDPPPHE